MRQKIKNHRKQGSFDKKFDFFPQTLSHIPRWVRFVQKTRAKNSHAWAPLSLAPSLCSIYGLYIANTQNTLKDLSACRQDCFVTGKWAVGQDAEELLNLDKEDEEEVSFCPFRRSGLT